MKISCYTRTPVKGSIVDANFKGKGRWCPGKERGGNEENIPNHGGTWSRMKPGENDNHHNTTTAGRSCNLLDDYKNATMKVVVGFSYLLAAFSLIGP
jgi:hypothetical protein